jgi:hypothetical protein
MLQAVNLANRNTIDESAVKPRCIVFDLRLSQQGCSGFQRSGFEAASLQP